MANHRTEAKKLNQNPKFEADISADVRDTRKSTRKETQDTIERGEIDLGVIKTSWVTRVRAGDTTTTNKSWRLRVALVFAISLAVVTGIIYQLSQPKLRFESFQYKPVSDTNRFPGETGYTELIADVRNSTRSTFRIQQGAGQTPTLSSKNWRFLEWTSQNTNKIGLELRVGDPHNLRLTHADLRPGEAVRVIIVLGGEFKESNLVEVDWWGIEYSR